MPKYTADLGSSTNIPLSNQEPESLHNLKGHSIEELKTVWTLILDNETHKINKLTAAFDAFDVIELLRVFVLLQAKGGFSPTNLQGDYYAQDIEIVSAILLGRGTRFPKEITRSEPNRPDAIVEEVLKSAGEIRRASAQYLLETAAIAEPKQVMMLASYRVFRSMVRNYQYEILRDRHDGELFSSGIGGDLFQKYFGFAFHEFISIRNALSQISNDRINQLLDQIWNLLAETPNSLDDTSQAAKLKELMSSFIITPDKRATISISDVSLVAKVPEDTVSKILDTFAQNFNESTSAKERVTEIVSGINPFSRRPLVVDEDGNYALTTLNIGDDSLRRMFEDQLTQSKESESTSSGSCQENATQRNRDLERYNQQVRQPMSERLAGRYLQQILRSEPERNFYYLYPKKGIAIESLDEAATDLKDIADRMEGDLLFLVDDVLLAVEIKAKSIGDRALEGHTQRFQRDIKEVLKEAAKQSTRVGKLVSTNKGYWSDWESWRDLSHIKEVRSIVVFLDDIGPVSTSVPELQAMFGIDDKEVPFFISLHDLGVIAELSGHPSEFLLYLRRRIDSPVKDVYRAVDELDLYALFLKGRLYAEAEPRYQLSTSNPKRLHRHRKPSNRMPIEYIGDESQEINRWFDYLASSDGPQPPKPTFCAGEKVRRLINSPIMQGRQGWFRFCTDFLSLSTEAHNEFFNKIEELANDSLTRGLPHSCLFGFDDMWGKVIFIFTTRSLAMTAGEAWEKHNMYLKAKKYQVKADRAYGLLYGVTGELEDFIYSTESTRRNDELEHLAKVVPLSELGKPRSLPLMTRRKTKKKPKKSRRKKN